MTLFDTRSPDAGTAAAPELSWSSPDTNLWVANRDGDYAGMVEFIDGHFAVQNAHGEHIATCSSIPEALTAREVHSAAPAAPAAVRFLATLASTAPGHRTPKTGYVRRGAAHSS